MPTKSEAQRRYLASKFGSSWMDRHHFDNKGKLPKHVPKHSKERDKKIAMFIKGR